MGKRHVVLGDYLFVCDQCGFTHYGSQGKEQWNHLFVCSTCFETRHPQDFVRGLVDKMNVPKARPRLYPNYKFVT